MRISIIAALADNFVIGKNNQLPWHMPADLKHFKTITMGKPIIMGRKTFESIGKPLPGRRNIIISSNQQLTISGCEVFNSLTAALHALQNCDEVMITGGAKIFAESLPLATHMYLTFIHHAFEGDTYFPKWNINEWKEIAREDFSADEKNPYSYSFITLERKRQS